MFKDRKNRDASVPGPPIEPIELTEAQKFSAKLRELARFYDLHPTMPVAYLGTLYAFPADKNALLKIREELAGRVGKLKLDSSYARLQLKFDSGLEIEFCVDRGKVCERRQVGTRKESTMVPVTTREEIVEVPVYEWICPDSLLEPDVEKAS